MSIRRPAGAVASTLHDLGSFDKMNPFTLRGNGPAGLTRYVFETLAVPSLDEPFAEYGLIAEDIALAPDRKSSDLHPQPQGALFRRHADHRRGHQSSLETLKSDPGHPFYQIYFRDIDGADILGERQVRFGSRTGRNCT